MKFKTYIVNEPALDGLVSSVSWSGIDEIYTCSDDHQILKWNSSHRESYSVAKLPDDFYPTDMNWLLTRSSVGGKGNDFLLITSSDGRFIILNKSARVEKNITAHAGTLIGRWSPDGSGLLTAGEDGSIKIWSRSGMLRSTVLQNESAIRCARWSPNSSAIVYCHGSYMAIKPLTANSKVTKWRAHEHLVLCIAWSNDNGLIASGGEDCRYKIWDAQGNTIFSSSADDFPITAIEFNGDGQLLAVGGFNMIRLCSCLGWTYSIIRFTTPVVGSLLNLNWSPDGTQILASSSKGAIIFGHVIEREKISRNLRAITTGRKKILLQDILTKTNDNLDFSEKILKWELNYGHLVVATNTQIHIFNESYVNTPIIIDGRSDVRLIILGKKNFVIVDPSSVWIYTYTGRIHLNPRFPSVQAQVQFLTRKTISLGSQALAIRDHSNQTLIHLFDLLPGVTRQEEPYIIQSKTQITDLALSQSDGEDQYIVFIDSNHDLYLTSCIQNRSESQVYKIGTQIVDVMWSSETNILAGLHDSSCYSVWYCPGEAANDPTLIALTTVTYDNSEFGRNVTLESFEGSLITFQSSGTRFTVTTKMYCEVLHKCIADGQWTQAVRICRLTQNQILWACLAAIATKYNQIEISEESFSTALQIDKVEYLKFIKTLPQTEQIAENSIMNGRANEAEVILLQNRKFVEAIKMAIKMHRWEKALEISEKHNIDVNIVLEERRKYLNAINREETSVSFLKK